MGPVFIAGDFYCELQGALGAPGHDRPVEEDALVGGSQLPVDPDAVSSLDLTLDAGGQLDIVNHQETGVSIIPLLEATNRQDLVSIVPESVLEPGTHDARHAGSR